jgi:hypothetical protein
MGRGRAKAKQTKVARQLKYNTGGTDLERLRAEIVGESGNDEPIGDVGDVGDEYEDDLYSRYADDEDEDEDGGSFEGNGRRPH